MTADQFSPTLLRMAKKKNGIANRGFASMTKARRIANAKAAGKWAHQLGRAHQYTVEEAIAAGKIGGKVVSSRPGYMSMIGKRGGIARQRFSQK